MYSMNNISDFGTLIAAFVNLEGRSMKHSKWARASLNDVANTSLRVVLNFRILANFGRHEGVMDQ